MKQAYTVLEAAQQMSLSRSTMYELIRQGKIAAVQVTPDKKVIRAAEIERFLSENEARRVG